MRRRLTYLLALALLANAATVALAEPHGDGALPQGALDALAVDLDAARAHGALDGRPFAALVVDAATGQTLYESGADTPRIPASNTKLFTTAAALALLGADHRMPTRAFADAPIDDGGVLAGDLHVHGAHDFTMSRWFYRDARVPFERLARRLYDAGLRTVRGDLVLWGAWCYEGHHFGTYAPSTHRARAGAALVSALRAAGIHVAGRLLERPTMDTPPGAELARWESPPLWVALWPINRKSHNEMADALLRHVGWVVAGESSFEAGARASLEWLASVGVDTTGAVMRDGSGLDVANRFTARQMVDLYRHMLRAPDGPAWLSSMSVGGGGGVDSLDGAGEAMAPRNDGPYNGTFAWRMTDEDVRGRVLGKSGTNSGITSTGVLFHRYDGHPYVFAFMVNGITSGAYRAARDSHDAMVAVIGRRHRAGRRPSPPVLQAVRRVDPTHVEVTWTPAPAGDGAATEFIVQTSPDGHAFAPEATAAAAVGATRLVVDAPADGSLYVRVVARDAVGTSEPSAVYGARAAPSPRAGAVLVVDAHERWGSGAADENLRGAAHAFAERYVAGLSGVGVDCAFHGAVATGAVTLDDYAAVVWALGEEAPGDVALDRAEQRRLDAYLAAGGRLMVSGSDLAWGLDPAWRPEADGDDGAFLAGALGVRLATPDAGAFIADPVPGGLLDGLAEVGFYTPGLAFVEAPDALLALLGAEPILAYEGAPGWAGVAYERGPSRVVALGFPFEAIDGADTRAAVLDRVLAYFGL